MISRGLKIEVYTGCTRRGRLIERLLSLAITAFVGSLFALFLLDVSLAVYLFQLFRQP